MDDISSLHHLVQAKMKGMNCYGEKERMDDLR